jgi:hypothetical protein
MRTKKIGPKILYIVTKNDTDNTKMITIMIIIINKINNDKMVKIKMKMIII